MPRILHVIELPVFLVLDRSVEQSGHHVSTEDRAVVQPAWLASAMLRMAWLATLSTLRPRHSPSFTIAFTIFTISPAEMFGQPFGDLIPQHSYMAVSVHSAPPALPMSMDRVFWSIPRGRTVGGFFNL
jgi:hypothetical protein